MNNLDLVKELRRRTGSSFKDCINALKQADSDLEKSLDILKKEGKSILSRKSGRQATEGVITASTSGTHVVLLSLKTETDFASRQDQFKDTANEIAQHCAQSGEFSTDYAQEKIAALALLIKENIHVGEVAVISKTEGTMSCYIHNDRIGALVVLEGGDESLARSVAMHVVAYQPLAIDEEGLDPDVMAREKAIYTEQAADKSSDESIKSRIVEGKIKKFVKENTLLLQKHLVDNTSTLGLVLAKQQVKVKKYQIIKL